MTKNILSEDLLRAREIMLKYDIEDYDDLNNIDDSAADEFLELVHDYAFELLSENGGRSTDPEVVFNYVGQICSNLREITL